MIRRFMLSQTLRVVRNTTRLTGREKQHKPASSMKNVRGEGNRKDAEGQRGELLQDGRGGTSGERAREQDKGSSETKSNVPLSIFVRRMGTRTGTAAIQLMIRVVLHRD